MKGIHVLIASMAASALALSPAIATADDELDITMEVIDDLETLEEEIARMEGPGSNDIEEDFPGEDGEGGDDEDDRSILDQFEEMDGEFDVDDENDGFEFENEDEEADREFESEDDFEEGEDVDDDEFDEIEEEGEDEMDGEIDVQDSLGDLDLESDEELDIENDLESDLENDMEGDEEPDLADEMDGDAGSDMPEEGAPGDIA